MTNAEKFKEVFEINFEYNLENVCPRPHTGACYYDDDGDKDCDTCVYEYWENNEYQGEPTIPLSVIEKITTEIEERATYEGIYLDRADVLDIIDKAVKEYTHENT